MIITYRCSLVFMMAEVPDLQYVHPFSMVVNGPSGCGKTAWIQKFLDYHMCKNIDKVVWCYARWQDSYSAMKNVEFMEGLNGIAKLDRRQRTLVILDDLMSDVNQSVEDLFIRGRHDNISVIFVTHNFFYKSQPMRTIRLNSKFLVLFNSPCDTSQVYALGRQLFPGNSKYFASAFEDATDTLYGYLLVDNREGTPKHFRLWTNIFPNEFPNVYEPI